MKTIDAPSTIVIESTFSVSINLNPNPQSIPKINKYKINDIATNLKLLINTEQNNIAKIYVKYNEQISLGRKLSAILGKSKTTPKYTDKIITLYMLFYNL
ncbi:hypothetical protein NL53_14440 [Vibrio variabilis]|uniref:Uncharacterized protein n=1 Tax=Vibrio variabilis TaxID=990271 RepID=A0ABR4Y8P7_9VIBR|nr:hypothetical protein NL53_14440 [Vibrio variabilis]